MTTLKLNKKSDDTQPKASKAPLRRGSSTVRDRSVSAAKVMAPSPEKAAAPTIEKATQRNHRFDGKAHGSPYSEDAPATVNSNTVKPAKPAGVDTRTAPRPDRNEPQYRQAPRRGGKMRDGYDSLATPQYGAAAKAAYKSTAISTDLPRLSKVMAERGICSRREADEWIANSWVMVDGEIIDTLGTRINPDAEIIISSYAHEVQSESVTIILHKPVGYVSGQAEDDYEPAIVLVHPDNEWLDDPNINPQHRKEFQRRFLTGLAPAGRLDIDSTGM